MAARRKDPEIDVRPHEAQVKNIILCIMAEGISITVANDPTVRERFCSWKELEDERCKIRLATIEQAARQARPEQGGLVMWPGADVGHYKLWVELAGLKSHLDRVKRRCSKLEGAAGIVHVEED